MGGCTCITPSAPALECPYHTMASHFMWMDDHFGDQAADPTFPLFPDDRGGFVTAEATVKLGDELAGRTNEPLEDKHGQRRFSKHTFRSMGAAFLSALGIELMKIQMLARWSSHIITIIPGSHLLGVSRTTSKEQC